MVPVVRSLTEMLSTATPPSWSSTALGFFALLAGIAMLVLPGPGLAAMAVGLALLGRRFTWAARTVAWARPLAESLLAKLDPSRKPAP